MATDETRIDEIRAWFDERGYDLYVHEVEGHGWRAPYVLKDSRFGSADYGSGETPLQAAEDAKARYTRDNAVEVTATASTPIEATGEVTVRAVLSGEVEKGKLGTAIETDTAQPIGASKTKAIGTVVDTVTVEGLSQQEIDERVKTLRSYGWRLLFEEEPDGKVTVTYSISTPASR